MKDKNTCCCDGDIEDYAGATCSGGIIKNLTFKIDGEFVYNEDNEKTGRIIKLFYVKSPNPIEATKYILEYTMISKNKHLHNTPASVEFDLNLYTLLDDMFKGNNKLKEK